ncbi:MAG: glycosyl transferase, partial [Cohnella sp.]|nr:glycosyl transferase [Cohnella sp.]
MKALKRRIAGFFYHEEMTRLREAERELHDTRSALARQRAHQRISLMRLESETEELKRRILAARMRMQVFRAEDARDSAVSGPPLAPASIGTAETQTAASRTGNDSAPAAPAAPRAKLGEALIASGLITSYQLETAIERQQAVGGRLGDILLDLGYVNAEQLLPYVTNAPPKGRLGDMLVQTGQLTREQLEKALSFQRKSGGMLGDILLSLQFLEPEQLYRAIATQNNLGRIGTAHEFDTSDKLPEPVARK